MTTTTSMCEGLCAYAGCRRVTHLDPYGLCPDHTPPTPTYRAPVPTPRYFTPRRVTCSADDFARALHMIGELDGDDAAPATNPDLEYLDRPEWATRLDRPEDIYVESYLASIARAILRGYPVDILTHVRED